MNEYLALHKPYGTLSQFQDEAGGSGLKHLLKNVSTSTYPVGRLDKDSEGLLLLTNDKVLHTYLLNPKWRHSRSYLVQVEGDPNDEQIKKLSSGVQIRIAKKDYLTKPAKVRQISPPTQLAERNPPVRFRKSIPTSWLDLTLIEGKNRQVRRMTAAVGLPTLRLIRHSIEDLTLNDIPLGEYRSFTKMEVYSLLKIPKY